MRPTREKLSPWAKTYAVARYKPEVLYLGNSRTETGLPAASALWGGRRAFNAAITGGSLDDAIAMARHARVVGGVSTYVWGIDFWSFSLLGGNTEFDRELIATDSRYEFARTVLNVKRSLSFDITRGSIEFLSGMGPLVCRSSLVFFGQRDERCAHVNLVDRGGATTAMVADVKAMIGSDFKVQDGLAAFSQAIQALCRADAKVLIHVNPTHAVSMYALDLAGVWSQMEEWMRSVVRIANVAREEGCDAKVFDFSGFNSISMEPIPQVTARTDMRNFWEASHYRTEIGKLILARLQSSNSISVPDDFGVELSGDMLDAHFATSRLKRDEYKIGHEAEAALVRTWISGRR